MPQGGTVATDKDNDNERNLKEAHEEELYPTLNYKPFCSSYLASQLATVAR